MSQRRGVGESFYRQQISTLAKCITELFIDVSSISCMARIDTRQSAVEREYWKNVSILIQSECAPCSSPFMS